MYLEKFRLAGKTAVVTGGGQGIGLACVEALAEAGAKVDHRRSRCRDRRARAGQPQGQGLRRRDRRYGRHRVRRKSPRSPTQLVKRYGKVDILVNNAGIARSETPAETSTDEHWLNVHRRQSQRHLLVLPRLRQAHAGGAVAAPSSTSARCRASSSTSRRSRAYYNASKAAVHHLTKSLAAEWGARGVRVNAVAPTYIETPLNAFVKSNPPMYDAWIGGTPMARLGEVGRDRLRGPVPGLRRREPDDRQHRAGRRRLYLLVGLRG